MRSAPPPITVGEDTPTELPSEGWVSVGTPSGSTSWHHTGLGPPQAPGELPLTAEEAASRQHVLALGLSQAAAAVEDACNPFAEDVGNPFAEDDAAEEAGNPNPFADDEATAVATVPAFAERPSGSRPDCTHDSEPASTRRLESARDAGGATLFNPLGASTAEVDNPFAEDIEQESAKHGVAALIAVTPLTVSEVPPLRAGGASSPAPLRPVVGAASEPVRTPGIGDLRAEVNRMTGTRSGWKRHDHRLIIIAGRCLVIYDKGSKTHAKHVVDVQNDLIEHSLICNTMISVQINAPRKRGLGCGSVQVNSKLYIFEFPDASGADAFHRELQWVKTTS
eukprot:NODE_4879_length_1835_cov_3.682670.p1 GENE.NODE_4879_length_1835_cov_3.682670~~NODE_4879_length_1835_cov_3.682670.p1  ORF type:complete len:337 (+),score=89.86 NODE_4879_length_1835_cov_3.682670:761-1771(+)